MPPPAMNVMPEPAPERTHALLIPIIGVGVVLLVLTLGGFYLWGSLLTEETPAADTAPMPTAQDTTGTSAGATASDDFSDLEAELNQDIRGDETDLEAIDAALDAGT